MSNSNALQPEIRIEETYTCTVIIAGQTIIHWHGQEGLVKVTVPYDGKHLHQQLPDQPLVIGNINLTEANSQVNLSTLSVVLPTGEELEKRIKRGTGMIWEATYPINPPNDTLVSVSGDVFDGADIDFDTHDDQIVSFLFGRVEDFVSDLRLRLTFWVPNLLDQAVIGRQNNELRDMLLEQESSSQILIAETSNETLIAQSMSALANSGGGRILLGVRPTGELSGVRADQQGQERIDIMVLRAALRSNPPVTFSMPDYIKSASGETVTRIAVPASRYGPHHMDGTIPRRQGVMTIMDSTPAPKVATPPIRSYGNLRDILAKGNTSDVVIIDARSQPINSLEFGQYMSGMVNAGVKDGIIVVRNLPTVSGGLSVPFVRRRGIMQQLNDQLDQERQSSLPVLSVMTAEFAANDDEQIAIIHIPHWQVPIMLYNSRGYLWNGSILSEIAPGDLLDHAVTSLGGNATRQERAQRTYITYGELAWPMQPPLVAKGMKASSVLATHDARYDPQRRAMIWQQAPFSSKTGTNGLECALVTSLRQSIGLVESTSTWKDVLEGEIKICFEHVLASGRDVIVSASHPLLSTLPIRKRTYINLKLTVRAGDLFLRRRHVALIRFQVSDVSYDKDWMERVADIKQALADLEFWIDWCDKVDPQPRPSGERQAAITGIRSKGYLDIRLLGAIPSPKLTTNESGFCGTVGVNNPTQRKNHKSHGNHFTTAPMPV